MAPTFATTNLDAKEDEIRRFMLFLEEISTPEGRRAHAKGDGVSDEELPGLASALNAMTEDELAFLARLKSHLDCAGYHDEMGNPKLYYF